MQKDLREKIRAAAEAPGISKPDFVELLSLIDQHYDKMEATITQSIRTATHPGSSAPIEAIFDSVTEALLSVSADGTIRNCNMVCTRYFKMDKDQIVGSNIASLLVDAGTQPIADYLENYMSSLDETSIELVDGEVNARRADGEYFVAEINASKLETVDGDIFVISMRDVTDRKRTEIVLRENEERYRALVENAPEAIIVFDVDSKHFTDANDKACELFNLSRARLLSIGPEAISPEKQPDGTPSFGVRRGYIDRALDGEHPIFEWMHQDSNGREIPCEVRFSRLPSDERRLIRVSITDIAERKREEALSYAQNKILEMIAASTAHDRTLRAICRFVEKLGENFKAAVMLLDDDRRTLSVGQAPSIGERFRSCLDSVDVAADSLTCGSAVFHAQDRIASDLRTDPAWDQRRQVASEYGVRAAWSFLIRGGAGQTIGTLDVYIGESRAPTTDELDRLSGLARLAGIAIKRQQDEDKLRSSETRYRGLFENVVDGVYIASREGDIIAANPALVEMLGYESVEDLKSAGKTTVLYVNPIDRERVFARLEAQGVVKNFEYRLRRKDGSEIVVLENSRAIVDDGKIVAHEGTITDITERKRAETRIFEEKERAVVTLQSIGDGVITTDADGRVDYINPVAQDLTGWDMRSARGVEVDDIMMIVNEHTRASVENPVIRCLKEGRIITLAENSVLITRNGDEVPIQDSAAPIRDRIGNIVGSVMVFHDVSKESRLFRQLSYQASHDALTGLINRSEFENRLIAALEETRNNSEEAHALLYVDLDQFKVVNDTFGHTAGDALLRQLSEEIQKNIRSTDLLSRLGGDEFGILLERCSEERALDVAESIRGCIEGYRFEWKDSFTTVRCSIGVVMITSENADVAAVMSSADVACYSAKDMGRNQVHLYRDSDASLRHEEMKWVSRITSAVEEERFELYFQPIIGIGAENDNSRGHYELLLRMRDEKGELVGPDHFIPAAERYNLMSTLDRWVIQEALTELADRNEDGSEARYTLAINLSGTSLSEDRFIEFVIDQLKKQALPDGAICFEITETAAISNLARVVYFMQTLKQLGCKFSLDDFGSGLSSFTYLKNLPVDYLKIDGQFIRNVVHDNVDESMVKAISEVGHAMGIETIAERVETKQVLDKLGSLGIEFAQGYYIARPASVQSFEPWSQKSGQLLA